MNSAKPLKAVHAVMTVTLECSDTDKKMEKQLNSSVILELMVKKNATLILFLFNPAWN